MILNTKPQAHDKAIKAVVQATNLPSTRVRAVVQYWQETGETGANMTARTIIFCYRSARLALDPHEEETYEVRYR